MRTAVSKLSRSACLLLIVAACSLALLSLNMREEVSANSPNQDQQSAIGSRPISLRRLGERPFWLNLAEGRDLPSGFTTQTSSSSLLRDGDARGLSLACGDFDEDGTPDLVCSYTAAGKGLLTIHRGNPDAIFANTPEAKQRKAGGTFTDAAFLRHPAQFELDSEPQLIFTGDFDADSHLDVLVASVGGATLSLLRGDGHGNLLVAEKLELDGNIMAITVGEINRSNGLEDIAVATATSSGPRLQIFSGPEGAFKAKPEDVPLPDQATAIAIGKLDSTCESDLAIAAGHELVVIHRPYKQSGDAAQAAVIGSRAFAYTIKQVAIGNFIRDEQHNSEIALMRDDGAIDLLEPSKQAATTSETGRQAIADWELESATAEMASASRMLAAKVSASPVDDLIVIAPEDRQVRIVSRGADGKRSEEATFESEDQPVAVIAMRLNASAPSGLVVLRAGKTSPVLMPQVSGSTITVNSTADTNTRDTNLTLREAILLAKESRAPRQ